MTRKKIIYVWKSQYPWDVRVEKICKSLSKEYEVLILARWNGEPKKAEQIDGITVKRVGFQKKGIYSTPLSFNPIWKKELESVVKGFKPDLIIVREIMLGTLVGKVGKKYNIPTMMDMAENYPALMKLWRKYNNSIFKKIIMQGLDIPKLVEKRSVCLMSSIIVVCEEQIQRLKDSYNYSTNKIRIIKNTPRIKENIKNDSSSISQKITFLHHGWLTEEKRIDNFIQAFINTYKNEKNFQLNIAGNGNCIEEYKQLASGVDNINFLGEYNYNQLDDIISESSIGILPYELNDFNNYTIHNKLFDYFALSKPVLVSEVKPLARVINQIHAGYIIDCSSVDSIENHFKTIDYTNIKTLGENAYKAYIERYNWDTEEVKLLEFVNEII